MVLVLRFQPFREDSQQIDFSGKRPLKRSLDIWGRGGGGGRLPRDVSLTPKNLDFSQLIICCWLELDIASLDVTESKIGLSWCTGSWILEDQNHIAT